MKKNLKRYLAIFVVNLKEAMMYRAELVLWSIMDAMPLIVMVVLWLTAFETGADTIGGYTQKSLIAYYIAGYVFQDITGSYFEEDLVKEIQSGKISTFLVKPISLKRFLVVHEIAWRIMGFFITVLPVILTVVVFATQIMPPVKLIYFLVIPPFLVLAYLLESIYSLMIVAIGFVFEEARSLINLRWMLGWLFSGSMIPFEFMPEWLAKLAYWLPFKFRYYVPVRIYLGGIEGKDLIEQFLVELVWLVILFFVLRKLWQSTMKKFTAVGN